MATFMTGLARTARMPNELGKRYHRQQDSHKRVILGIELAYIAVLGGGLLYTRNWPTSDQVAIGLFIFAILMARPLAFLRDWSPFMVLLLSYEAMRGASTNLIANTHVGFPITMDHAVFGTLPTVWLQEHLWDPNHLHWYDYLAAFMHPMHFIVPLGVAFAFWMRDRKLYWKFVLSYLLVTYAGFITYVLYPMAPPWWASQVGAIPHVDTILGQVLGSQGVSHPITSIYSRFDANPVAAMPSLHAAFPVLVWLICWKLKPKYGWALIFYPLIMDFAVVYMGEHYVIDVVAGSLYGAAGFAAVWVLPDRVREWRQRRALAPHPVLVGPQPVPERVRAGGSVFVEADGLDRGLANDG